MLVNQNSQAQYNSGDIVVVVTRNLHYIIGKFKMSTPSTIIIEHPCIINESAASKRIPVVEPVNNGYTDAVAMSIQLLDIMQMAKATNQKLLDSYTLANQ